MDINELIRSLHNNPKVQAKSGGVYRDEPIIRTAAQMAQVVPPRIRQMRTLTGTMENGVRSLESLFYQQAVFMRDFTDNFPSHSEFVRYYPTYQTLTDVQLREYFTWRAQVREGNICKTAAPFAFLYLYELLHLIGVSSAQEGYEALSAFYRRYLPLEPDIGRYVPQWMEDFAVYYHLPPQLRSAEDAMLETLADTNNVSPHERVLAMNAFSRYAIVFSAFYKKYTDLTEQVLCMAFDRLTADTDNALSMFFGARTVKTYQPFAYAVFYDHLHRKEYVYAPSAVREYRCINGHWTQSSYVLKNRKSQKISELLRSVDAQLRIRMQFPHKLKIENADADLQKVIEGCISEVLAAQQKAAAPQVSLDLSKLQGIRSAAAETCDKLISDEERSELAAENAAKTPASAPLPQNALPPLSENALALLRILLYGGDSSVILHQAGVLPAVLADEINEAFYDDIGDSVLDDNGSEMTLFDDYIDELKEKIPKD